MSRWGRRGASPHTSKCSWGTAGRQDKHDLSAANGSRHWYVTWKGVRARDSVRSERVWKRDKSWMFFQSKKKWSVAARKVIKIRLNNLTRWSLRILLGLKMRCDSIVRNSWKVFRSACLQLVFSAWRAFFPRSYLTRMEVFLVERCAAVSGMLLYLHTNQLASISRPRLSSHKHIFSWAPVAYCAQNERCDHLFCACVSMRSCVFMCVWVCAGGVSSW